MDTSVPRVTVCQNNDLWDRFVHPYLSLMSGSNILAHFFVPTLESIAIYLKNVANLCHPLCFTLFSDALDMNTFKVKRHRNSDTEKRQQGITTELPPWNGQ